MRFDFEIILNNNKILLEFDGKQHFLPDGNIFTEEKVLSIQKNDKKKNEYCLNNNIILLRIPYIYFNKLKDIILDIIKTNKIPEKFLTKNSYGPDLYYNLINQIR